MDPCTHCGETRDMAVFAVSFEPVEVAVRCLTCRASGPPADSAEQAIANWNRRPASTLADSCLTGNFDEIDGRWNGEGDLRTTWWNRGVVDGLRTALRLAVENGHERTVTQVEESITHHSAVLARLLAATGEALGDGGLSSTTSAAKGRILMNTPDVIEAARVLFPPGEADARLDELAAARDRRAAAPPPKDKR